MVGKPVLHYFAIAIGENEKSYLSIPTWSYSNEFESVMTSVRTKNFNPNMVLF